MSEPKHVVSHKFDGGAPWYVVHADDATDMVKQHREMDDAAIDDLIIEFTSKLQAKYAAAKGLGAVPVAPTNDAATVKRYAQPVVQPAPAQPADGETCVHGAMTLREGTSSKGPWTGYFCPTPKGTPDQCSPHFVR